MRLSGRPAIFFHRLKASSSSWIDGDRQLVLRQTIFLGDQRPGPFNGIRLEIVAKGKIAQHFEKRVVACCVAHIVEVIVLAAGAHAFLRGGRAAVGALFHAGKGVLELHHAGIGKHQRGVIARHQRRGRHHLVALAT